ncbi:hypothetical protein D3C71_1621440 [compost metagenome]
MQDDIDATFQVCAKVCLQVFIGDAQRLHVRSGDPAQKAGCDFYIERISVGDGRENASRCDVVGKGAEHSFHLAYFLPLEFVSGVRLCIHPAPQFAQRRKHTRRKISVCASSNNGNHAAEVLVLEVFGFSAL